MAQDVAAALPPAVPYGDHESQFLEVSLPDGPGPHPVVMLIHGGFWRLPWGLELMRPLAADLARRGFAAVNIEYRRLGEAGGGWPGTCLDVELALRKIGVLHATPGTETLDPSRVGLVGHSAGGHLALWAAAALRGPKPFSEPADGPLNPDVAAPSATPVTVRSVVSLASVSDLRAAAQDRLDEEDGKPPAAVEFMGGAPDDAPVEYLLASPISLLPLGTEVAQLIVHGDLDNRVPIEQSLDYYESAAEAGDRVEFARFPAMGHFEVIDPTHESWAASVSHLVRTLHAG